MKKYIHLLERLGMSEAERSIYLALLEHPYITISDISRYTHYHRPTVYKTIHALESDGYVEKSYLDGKRYYYHTTSPTKLREKLASLETLADRILPELEAIHARTAEAPVLSVREGIEGIRSIHGDLVHSLKKGGVYYRYSSSREGHEKRTTAVPDDYFDIQKSKELSRYVITNSIQEPLHNKNPYREIMAIPSSFDPFDDNITKIIYSDKVAIIDYNSQMGWIIENERFARYEEKIFRLLFSLLKKNKKPTVL